MVNKIILSAVLVTFLGGLLLGYGIWGRKQVEEKTDVKTLLTEAIKRVEDIRRENRNFQKEVAAAQVAIQEAKLAETRTAQLEVNINALKEENADLQSTVDQLQYEISALQSVASESGEGSGAGSDQKMQITDLREKNAELAAQLEQAKKAEQDLQAEVSRLETELAKSPARETGEAATSGETSEGGRAASFDELESVNQGLAKEIEKLREENQGLKSSVAQLEKALADAQTQPRATEEKGLEAGTPPAAEGAKKE